MTHRPVRMAFALTMAVVAVACSTTPDVVLFNRSERDIAFLPGVIVASCDSVALTNDQVAAGNDEFRRWLLEEDDPLGWVPAGAVQYSRHLSGARIGDPDPMTVIVSGVADPVILQGQERPDLPDCGGEPVGIE